MQNDSSSQNAGTPSGTRRDHPLHLHVPLVRDRSSGRIHTGRYVLEKEIGAGGMARIYSAEDPALARSVAVKLPHVPELGGRERLVQVSDRMSIEALALARVRHPQVLQIHDFDRGHWDEGRWNRPPYLVTERVPGGSLVEYVAEHGRFRPEAVALIGVSLGRSLFAVHAQGIVHRDVKPANVLVDLENPGRLVLSDFGTACFPGAGLAITGKDEMPGTLGYMAPEQLLRRKVDGRTDVFALGVTLYELVAGRRPFVAEGREALLAEIRRGRYDRLSALVPRVPRYLEAVIDRCLKSRPGRRWESVGYVIRELEEGLASEGMDCVGRELERCFMNPPRYVAELDARLVKVGLVWAETALRQGLQDVARVWCERVLVIEPGQPRAMEVLGLLGGQKRGKGEASEGTPSASPSLGQGKGTGDGGHVEEVEGVEDLEARVLRELRRVVGERRQRVRRMGWFVGIGAVVLALVAALVPWSRAPLPPKAPGIEGREGASAEAVALRRRFEALTDGWKVQDLAAERLTAGDGVAFGVMVELLAEPEMATELKRGLEAALVVPGRSSLDLMLEHIERSPHRPSAAVVARLLGEVAQTEHDHGGSLDPRIVPALLRAVNARLSEGTASITEPMETLGKIVRLGPIEHADLLMADVLDHAFREDGAECDQWVVWHAARVLLSNEGEMGMSRLRERIQGRGEKDMRRRAIERAIEAYQSKVTVAL